MLYESSQHRILGTPADAVVLYKYCIVGRMHDLGAMFVCIHLNANVQYENELLDQAMSPAHGLIEEHSIDIVITPEPIIFRRLLHRPVTTEAVDVCFAMLHFQT